MNIYKLEDRVLFEAAAAVEAADAAEHQNQNTSENKNQPESAVREQQLKEALQNAGPQQSGNPDQLPLSARKQNLPGAAQWEHLPDALRGLESHPEYIDAEVAEHFSRIMENFLHNDTANGKTHDIQFQDIFARESVQAQGTHKELVIVNSSVTDVESVVGNLNADTEVLYLQSGKDAFAQIQNYLNSHDNERYDAIHLVSHGNDGFFVMNGKIVDQTSVQTDRAEWKDIGSHLSQDGDLLLYGCNLAETSAGKNLVGELADITGADVAASVNRTGLGGDGVLEFRSGSVETAELSLEGYRHSLTAYQVTTNADSGIGSLRQAILDANAQPGGGEITFAGDYNIQLNSELTITDDLTITGTGINRTVISANQPGIGTWRAFHITSGEAQFSDLTIQGGSVDYGAGIYVDGTGSSLDMNRVLIENGSASVAGSGVYVNGGSAEINNSLIYGTTGNGGIYIDGGGSLDLLNSTVTGNASGGVVIHNGTGNLANDIVAGNGGADLIAGSSGTLHCAYNFYGSSTGSLLDLGGNVGGSTVSSLFGTAVPVPDALGRITPVSNSIAIGNGTLTGSYASQDVFYDYSSSHWKYIDGSDSSGIVAGNVAVQTGDQTAASGTRGAYYVTAGSIDFNISSAVYQSNASGGNWSSASSWQAQFAMASGASGWVVMSNHTPDADNAGAIAILGGSTITVDRNVHADQVTVAAGGTLSIGNGNQLSLGDGAGSDLVNNGSVIITGSILPDAGASWMNNTGSSVIYNGTTQTVLGGTYYNLTLSGGIDTLGGNVVVNGLFTNLGTVSGNADLTLNGTVAGNGNFAMSGGNVTYRNISSVFAGTYYDLTVSGSGAGLAGDADVLHAFNAGNQLFTLNDHTLTLGGNVVNLTLLAPGLGSVIYNGAGNQTVAGVTYYNLTLSGANNTLGGDAVVNGLFTNTGILGGSASLTLNGTAAGNGSVNMTGGTVVYNASMTAFGGTYYNLTVSGAAGTVLTASSGLNIGNILTVSAGTTLALTASDANGLSQYQWSNANSVLSGAVLYSASGSQTVLVDSYEGGLQLANGTKQFLSGTYLTGAEIAIATATSITLNGAGVGSTILSVLNPGVSTYRVLNVNNGVLFVNDMHLRGGNVSASGNGGVILSSQGILALARVTITDGRAMQGGGIYLGSSTLYLGDTTIIGNSATGSGGGIYFASGSINMVNATIVGNNAGTSGGGLFAGGVSSNITNSILLGNTRGGSTADDFYRSQGTYYVTYSIFGAVSGGFVPVTDTNWLNASVTDVFQSATPVLNADGTVHLSANSIAIGNGTRVGGYGQSYVFFDYPSATWKYLDGSNSSGIVQQNVTVLSGDALGASGRRGNYYTTVGALDYNIQSAAYQSFAAGDWFTDSNWKAVFTLGDGSSSAPVLMRNHTPDAGNSTGITISLAMNLPDNLTADEIIITSTGNLTVNSGVVLTLNNQSGTDLVNNGILTLTGNILFSTGASWTQNSGSTVIYNGVAQTLIPGSYYNLTLGGSGAKTLGGNIGVDNNFDAGNQNVVLGSNTLTLSNAVTHFTSLDAGTGTVVYNGALQNIAALTYYNLTLLGGSNYFQAGDQTAVNGTFSVHGTASSLAQLLSSSSGSQWILVLGSNATADIEYVKVQDANSNNMITLNSNNLSGGNNTNWNIVVDLSGVNGGTITFGDKLGTTVLNGSAVVLGSTVIPGTLLIANPNTLPQVSDSGVTQYQYTFTGSDSTYIGNSTFTVTVLPRNITVKVGAGQGKSYGNADPNLQYSITSGSLIGGDSFSGSLTRASGEAIGSYAVTQGTLALNGNYSLTVVPGSFTISQRNVTVTLNDATKIYGNADPALTYQISSGSLASGDAFTGSIVRAAGENVGTYAITKGTLALNSNYNLTIVNGDFTITVRSIGITGDSGSKVYGTADPSLGYRITSGSLAAGDSISGNVLRVEGENVGSYLVRIGTLSLNSNYAVTYVNGTLTVTPAAIEITANNGSKIYGDTDPQLTYKISSGALVGDDSLSGNLLRVGGENAGTYAINQGTLSAGNNYTVTFRSGTFTIQQRAVTVALHDNSKVYGNADPALAYTVVWGEVISGDSFSGSPTRTAGENVGNYTISQGSLTLGANYILTVTGTATFSITPRYVEVAANPTGKTYGDTDPSLSYTLVSGNLATGDSFSGTLTRASGENVGTYAITQGSLALNGNYVLKVDSNLFTISPRVITVTGSGTTKTYGDADPVLHYTYTGTLIGGDVFTGSLTRDPGVNVGTYAVTQGSLALNSNYTLVYNPGTLTVAPRPITIIANNVYQTLLDPNPALTWSVRNLIPGDSYTGALSVDPITHVISIGTLSYGPNYTATFVSGNLIINNNPIVTITINAATKVYGDSDPTFTYTVAGLSTPLTWLGTTARAAGENVGEYGIYLSSFHIFNGVVDVTGLFNIRVAGNYLTITPRPITVTPNSGQSMVYNGGSGVNLGYTASGAINGDIVDFGGSLVQPGIHVGSYAIAQGSLYSANSNYSVNFIGGVQFRITPAPLTITANNLNKTYGDADPALTWQITSGSLVHGDNITGALSRTPGTNVGNYQILQNTLTAGNDYTITYNAGNLHIAPRQLVVTVTPGQSREYDGTNNAVINYTYTNLVSGDANPLSGSLAQQGINVGTYEVNAGTLTSTNSNYTFILNAGIYQITARQVTISADAQTKIYGYTDPQFTWKVTSGSVVAGDVVDGSLSRASGETVGVYAIGIGSLNLDSNYSLTFVGNTLTVTHRTVLVTANGGGKIYGDADPALGYTIATGSLASGDAFSGSIVRTAGENAGTYVIGQGTLGLNSNYVLVFVADQFVISQRPITVTANNQTKVYGNADPALTYQITSGNVLPTDSLSGSLVRTGNQNAGTYSILQGTLGNSNYAITYVAGTFTVTPRPITVTADSGQSKIYGNSNPNYTWQVTSGSLLPGDSLYGGLSRSAGENVNTYALTQGSLGNGNYAITYVGATFAITPRPITVAPDAGQGKIYGNADPALRWSLVSGNFVGGDNLSGSIVRVAGENAGSYAILQGTLANSNYTITYLANNFTISPRAITIGANSGQSKVYGNADPTLTWKLLSGSIVSGDTFAGSLGRVGGENVGSYAINIGTFSNANYAIKFFGNTFSITARPITVTATPGQGKIYGNSDPSLTWEVTAGSMISGDTLTGSQTRVAGETVGSYNIYRGSLNNANYAITYVNGSFAISPRPITVAPTTGQGKIYGNADQLLTWQIIAGNLIGTDSLNGGLARVAGENAGNYAILQNTLANKNYSITFVSNDYTISPRPIAVGAVAGQGKIYGNADLAYQWQLLNGNFIGSDTLTGSLVRAAGETVGSYAFGLGTLANANYAVSFVAGNPFVISGRAITVTADSGQGKVYGSSDPALLTWQITSGALVSGDALTGSLVRAAGETVGSYAISQGTLNNANYIITYVSANFSVSPRPITVTADGGKTKVYGTIDPAFTYQITSGALVSGDQLSGSLGRIPGENVGSYAITQGSLGNSNYTITFVSNPMTITARPITVTPDSGQNKIYGNADPVFTYQITSGTLVGSDSLSGALSRVAGNDVGTYAITQGTLNNSNYQITFTNGVLFTINQRSITVSPTAGQSKIYGNADPVLGWTVTSGSLAYSDTLSGAMVRDAGENVGNYAIHKGTLSASSNYIMTFQENGVTFAVNVRPITVTATAGQNKVYGNADPTLTYSITSGSLVFSDTLSGSIVRAAGENVGSYAITRGTLSASSNYALTFVNGSFSVSRRPVTVTADSGQTKVYGNANPTPYTWQITSGTLVGSDSLSGLLSRSTGENVGSYNLTQGTLTNTNNPNYNITFVTRAFTITARPISITPDSGLTKVYGNSDPTLTWHLVSGNMIGSDNLSGSMTRDSGNNVGNYTIRQGTLANSNYAITFITGPTFAITARPITVTPTAGQGKVYGNSDPSLTWVFSSGSLAYSDSLSGSMTRAAGENVGTYAISQGSLSASSNYVMTFVNGSFAVTPRPITVAPTAGQNKIYGNSDPSSFNWGLTSGTLVNGDTLSGSMIRAVGENVGSYAITQGTLAATSNYTMTFVNGSFAITQRPVTVTVTPGQTKVYGTSDPLPFAWQVTSGNLISGDSLSGALTRAAGENVGSYAISQGTLANSNYAITFSGNNFTITKSAITITPNSGQNKVYGNADPTLTWQLVSGTILSGDTLTGALSRDSGQNVGYYTITQGTLNNGNYAITFLTGPMFQITTRPITVTATGGQSKVYGNGDPVLAYQITSGSLAYSDSLSGALGRAAGENVGSYAINQGSLSASTNYSMTYIGSNFSITPRAITVAPISNQGKVYGNSDPTLNWQLTSGSLVGGDSLSGSIIRAAGENVGSYAITQGSLAATSNYTMTFVNGSFAITARPITVTANPGQSKVYGNADPALAWQITSGNLISGDSLSGALSRHAGENVDSYAIQQGTLANSNYAITFVSNNFAITARPVTVTATPGQSKVYGNADPTLVWQITSGNLISGDSLSGALSRNAGENVGSYAIRQGTLGNSNYAITFVSNNFAITARPVTITATPGQSKIYGSSDPALTWYLSSGSLIGSDTLSGSLTRVAGESVGSYAILQGSVANSNYAITFVSNNFTIALHSLTVTVNSGQSKVYGYSDPSAFTWQITSGSLVGGDTLSGSLTRIAGENTGSYAILQGTLGNSNYAITFIGSNFTITARPITVTATPGQSKVYGNSDPVSYNWQVTSGSLVGGDSLSGSLTRAAGENVGSYTILQGTLSASSNYILTYASSGFTIAARPVTVTVTPGQSKIYGNSDPASLAWQITSGSLVGGDSLSGSLIRAAGENVGSYAITQGSLGNSNYAITFIGNNFAITARSVTVSANAGQSKTYGNADPALTWTISSGTLIGSDTITGSLTRAAGENAGSYAILQGTLSASSNYALTYIGSNFTITPRPITVAPNSGQNKVYGTSDPVLSWQITNGTLVGGDSLSGSLTRVSGESAGTYGILQGTLGNANYAVTFTGGVNFTINQAPITVTANSGQGKVYGYSDPSLAWQITSGALVGTDTLSGALSRVAGENAGNYAILQGTLNNSNYLITYIGANFAIAQRAVTITADGGQGKVYGNADPVLTWQITSGTLVSGDVATGSLSRNPGENVGSYDITQGTLTLGGNYILTYVSANFAITPRAITVTSDAGLGKVYGNSDSALTWQITSGSLVGTDGYTGSLTRAAGETVGSYAISQGTLSFGSNYTVSFVNSGFAISQRAIQVSAENGGKIYGDADPALVWQITNGSLVFGDAFTGDVARASGENAGTYVIGQGTLALNSNYQLSFVSGTFTIAQRSVTVTVDNSGKTYGNADPALTYRITSGSLVFGDLISGTPVRVAGEDVGSYDINQGTLALSTNYILNVIPGSFTITARAVTVTGGTLTRTYGDSDPALTYQITSGSLASGDSFTGTLTRDAGNNVGSYDITQGSLALNSNYALTYVNGQLTITPRAITITADPKSKTETLPDPALTWTVSNLVPGDTASGALTRQPGEAPGTYEIELGTLTYGSNYQATFVGALFTINSKVTVSITIDAETKVYGTADPAAYTFGVVGLTPGYTYTSVLNRAAGENVGNYLISMTDFQIFDSSGNNATNLFNINVTNNNLTITPATITVTPDAGQGKVYDGTSNANLTFTWTGVQPGDTVTFDGSLSQNGIHVGTSAIELGTLQSLNPNYQISFVGGTAFTVTQRSVTVTADNQSKIYGDADPALTYTLTSGSLVSGDVFSGVLNRDPGNDVGNYQINQNTLSLSGDYQLTFQQGTLSITPRTVSVTVEPGQSKQYDGTSDANITYTYTNAAYGDTGFITGALAQNGINAGTYNVNMGTLASSSGNYTLVLVPGGTLQITPRQITVAADAGQGKIYGYSDPNLTWSVTSGSIVSGDVSSGVLSRDSGEDVGTYAIRQGSLDWGANYAVTFVSSGLNISARSVEVTANNQTKVYGNADPAFTYTVTQGSVVSGDQFTGSLDRVIGENVGNYSITQGSLALNGNYVLTFVNGTLAITPRAITIQANPGQGKIYGSTDPSLSWSLTGGSFAPGDTLQGSMERAAGETVGTYAVTQGTLDNSNYAITFIGTEFAITPRAITVTADAGQNKVYGNADPALTWTVTSGALVSGDSLTGVLTRDSGENVGLYAIAQGTLANSNYLITFVGNDFAVTPRSITITPDVGQGKVYGNADSALTWSITSGSLVTGDSITGTLTRVAGENVGLYAITQGTLTAGSNYTLTFAAQNYAVTPRSITVESTPGLGKIYGNADPALTYQITQGTLVSGDSFSGELIRAVGENAGFYAVHQGTLTLGSNYSIVYVDNGFHIAARAVQITINNAAKTYGESDPAFTYRITSGSLVPTDAFTGELARDPGENVGAYTIRQGTLALNSNYILSVVNGTLQISQRTIQVTADNQSKIYGDADPSLTYRITSGSLAFTDEFSGTLTRDPGENVGSYSITQGTLALNGNYNLTFVHGTLHITQRQITVTADNQTKSYGDSDPSLTYRITSGSLAFTDEFTGTLTRDSGENVGNYTITQGTLALNGNYALNFVNGTLAITPRAITVTADSGQGKVYGDADSVLKWTVTAGNLVGSDTLHGSLVRESGENVGNYDITQGSLGNSNYALTFIGAEFAITPRAITVTADSGQGKTYGNADPALTYHITSGTLVGSDTLDGALTRDSGEDVGAYAITQGTLDNSNYLITFVGSDFTVTPRNITITPDAGQSKIYGNADSTLLWTITSGSLVSGDSIAGALSRDAGENVDAYAITQGSLTAGSNYVITLAAQTYAITPRSITVESTPGQGKTYGDGEPILTYQITSGSLVEGDSFAGALTRDAGENVGIYAVGQGTLTLGNNYTLTYNGNTFVISARAIQVTAGNSGKTYGDSDPAFTYTITSGTLAFSDAFTGELSRDAGENVGSYAITQGTLALNSNYVLSFVNGTLQISQRSIQVTADNQTKTYGNADPSLTYRITSGSLVGSDTLNGTLTRDSGENVGSYTIRQGTLDNSNYAITFLNGTLAIEARAITVAANNVTRQEGRPDPALTYKIISGSLVKGDSFTGELARQPGEKPGNYQIEQNTLALSSNYTLAYVPGMFTITPPKPVQDGGLNYYMQVVNNNVLIKREEILQDGAHYNLLVNSEPNPEQLEKELYRIEDSNRAFSPELFPELEDLKLLEGVEPDFGFGEKSGIFKTLFDKSMEKVLNFI